MPRKKRATRYLSGCPKCGGHWTKISGIYRCSNPKCQHVYGSQNPSFTEYRDVRSYPQKRGPR
jgi:hypothetical protein